MIKATTRTQARKHIKFSTLNIDHLFTLLQLFIVYYYGIGSRWLGFFAPNVDGSSQFDEDLTDHLLREHTLSGMCDCN
jgi:hypothetical protein